MVCPSLVVLSLRQPGLLASSHVTYFGCDHNRVLDDGLSPASASILSIGFLCALSQRYVRVVDAYFAAHINILATWLPCRDSGVKLLGDVNISKRICWVGLSVFVLLLYTYWREKCTSHVWWSALYTIYIVISLVVMYTKNEFHFDLICNRRRTSMHPISLVLSSNDHSYKRNNIDYS